MKGYFQIYTGNGKGKTTAAIGLAVRAAGAGLNILFAQFVKGMKYNEITALEQFKQQITIKQYGRRCFIKKEPQKEDIEIAAKGIKEIDSLIKQGEFDLVILDEACIALYYSLFTVNELLKVIKSRPEHCEIVVTGRNAPLELIEAADLVTEMKEIKHYFNQGVQARNGIEK